MADAMPALGIVAAVLGVIHTMGSITEPPEVLGHLIGARAGAAPSWACCCPMVSSPRSAAYLGIICKTEATISICIKCCLLAHMMGYAPQVSIEFGRKTLPPHVRPTF